MIPEISVQVPVKNGGKAFRSFLGSLAAQDILTSWELVIVDDGSDVPVQEEFSRELALLPELCSFQVLRRYPGGVRPAARNQALKTSTAPVALLMDADLEFGPALLRRHLEVRNETGADVVMGKRINAWSPDATPWQKWFDTRAMGNAPSGEFPWNYLVTGNISITRSLLEDIGGFDIAISSYGGEDTELGYRISKSEAMLWWEPELTVNHLDDVSVRKHSEKMLEYGGTGLRYMLNKHPDIGGLLGNNWVKPVFSKPVHLCFMRLLTRVSITGPVYRTVLRYAEKHGRPSVLFTYLAVGAILTGLRGGDYHK